MDEKERIAQVYGERKQYLSSNYYSLLKPGNLYLLQRRERTTLALFRSHGIDNFAGLRILEVGCGSGGELLRLVSWGAQPPLLAGVDLLAERILVARQRLPEAQLEVADARALPFPAAHFDLVMQLTLFSSVLDPGFRQDIAAEMLRVLKPGGLVFWYDMRMVRPDRPLVAISRPEIRRLFSPCAVDLRAHTLNPLLARTLGRVSWLFCDLVALLPFLKSHYIGLFRNQLSIASAIRGTAAETMKS
ncbi:MAG: class I SAM-dependent methyltransferase [Cyanobacteria bacterium NC_groundwater_1444_Ag_S-0.65um_54_12]|nr:class I SAM-dependent methyltransferase [Cyanobacteria bacterium NC_groundwater_1444_Ag_S-0.65um_54_12]